MPEQKQIQVGVAKEIDDVMLLLLELARTIKEKGDFAQLTDELIVAIQGADKIPDEVKGIPFDVAASAMNRGLDIAKLFLDKKEGESEDDDGGI